MRKEIGAVDIFEKIGRRNIEKFIEDSKIEGGFRRRGYKESKRGREFVKRAEVLRLFLLKPLSIEYINKIRLMHYTQAEVHRPA